MKVASFRSSILFLLILALVSGCSGALPANPTAAPATPIPLSERDLSTVVMQADELSGEFSDYSAQKLEGVFAEVSDVHTGVVNSHVVLNKTGDSRHVYTNGIIVYEDAAQAEKAYQAIIDGTQGDSSEIAEIGDETYALSDTITSPAMANTIYLVMILWRYDTSVGYLSSADSDDWPSKEQMENLAQKIQGRLENNP